MTEAGGGGKPARVRALFDRLAPRYDLMNRVMTLGQDQRWRRFVARRAEAVGEARVLDLAAGTGDIAFEVKRRWPEADVVAADFSINMLLHGRRRPHGERVRWIACDAMNLPFPDGWFDAVVFGYLLRNVGDIDRTLREAWRALKPGGRIVCLDTSPPPRGPLRPLIRLYLRRGLPLLGRMLARDADAYDYLCQSTLEFETPEALAARFVHAGFAEVEWRRFMFGTVAVHWARKPKVRRG